MENSNEQRWVKSALMPTISILENEGRLAPESCHAPFAEFPAHPQSHAAPTSSSVGPTKACWRIQISLVNNERTRRAVYRSGEKKIPMLVTRAERHLQRSMRLSQERVLGDQEPASDRRMPANVALYHEPRDFDIFGFDVTVLRNRRIRAN